MTTDADERVQGGLTVEEKRPHVLAHGDVDVFRKLYPADVGYTLPMTPEAVAASDHYPLLLEIDAA
jgi:hypothetical protein